MASLTGRAFGRLTVLGPVAYRRWRCVCACGGEAVVTSSNLYSGNTKSCGCLRREMLRSRPMRHGHAGSHNGDRVKTPEYRAWQNAKRRCVNPADKHFRDYGGRGIRMCDEWAADFPAFLAHLGLKPSRSHSLDRIDNDGDYAPGNVHWATPSQQLANRRPYVARGRYST